MDNTTLIRRLMVNYALYQHCCGFTTSGGRKAPIHTKPMLYLVFYYENLIEFNDYINI